MLMKDVIEPLNSHWTPDVLLERKMIDHIDFVWTDCYRLNMVTVKDALTLWHIEKWRNKSWSSALDFKHILFINFEYDWIAG